MISGELLQHVPGCENGDAPYSQELLGGGKVTPQLVTLPPVWQGLMALAPPGAAANAGPQQ